MCIYFRTRWVWEAVDCSSQEVAVRAGFLFRSQHGFSFMEQGYTVQNPCSLLRCGRHFKGYYIINWLIRAHKTVKGKRRGHTRTKPPA